MDCGNRFINGFNITSSDNTIQGLSIVGCWGSGVAIYGTAAQNNVISGNFIGVNPAYDQQINGVGVYLGSSASNNTIGGTSTEKRNCISGNAYYGINLESSASLNIISGNYIGIDCIGSDDLGNGRHGIQIKGGASSNVIGGDTAGERNIISGNDWSGIAIYGTSTQGNTVSGNYIGASTYGGDMGNGTYGIYLYDGTHDNLIGGDTKEERNVVSGNGPYGVPDQSCGILISGTQTTLNTVIGNFIGTDNEGGGPTPNGYGVVIMGGAHHNTIGSGISDETNLVSGNNYHGVSIIGDGTQYNTIAGNWIGLAYEDNWAIGNNGVGVFLGSGSQLNMVEGNVISDNDYDGVYLNGSGTMSNTVLGNYIGTNHHGLWENFYGNLWYGVRLDGGAKYNRIGGATAAERNIIAGNERDGVRISGNQTMSNTVLGNYIGVSSDGVSSGSNLWYGVTITDGAKNNLVGGNASGEGNVISDNDDGGVQISGNQTAYNQVSGNIIGLLPDGASDFGNNGHGVFIGQGANHNFVGGERSGVCEAECNVISGNQGDGVRIDGNGTISNTVSGNLIGTDILGSSSINNLQHGVNIRNGAQFNLIGGNLPNLRNIISGNTGYTRYGISIQDSGSINGTKHNRVLGNYIGLDVTGLSALPNFNGIGIEGGASENIIGGTGVGEGNVISANGTGIEIFGSSTSDNQVVGNLIGTAADGLTEMGNTMAGIYVHAGAQDNTIGPDNLIAYHPAYAVWIEDEATQRIFITRNSIYANFHSGISLELGVNGNIQHPEIDSVTGGSYIVEGTACPGCLVELFSSPGDYGEGKHFQGDDMADTSGNFSISISHLLYPYLTATATDILSGTSMFSISYWVDNAQLYLPLILR